MPQHNVIFTCPAVNLTHDLAVARTAVHVLRCSYHPHHCVYATWGTLEGWVKSFESNAGAPTTAGVGFQ